MIAASRTLTGSPARRDFSVSTRERKDVDVSEQHECRTRDRVPIKLGLRVIDYDAKPGVVVRHPYRWDLEDEICWPELGHNGHWWEVCPDRPDHFHNERCSGGSFDGSRLTTRGLPTDDLGVIANAVAVEMFGWLLSRNEVDPNNFESFDWWRRNVHLWSPAELVEAGWGFTDNVLAGISIEGLGDDWDQYIARDFNERFREAEIPMLVEPYSSWLVKIYRCVG